VASRQETPDVANAAFHFFLEDTTMNISSWIALTMITLVFTGVARADAITVQMNAVNDAGVAELLGVVVISEVTHGLEFTPDLAGLSPGANGFHVHENPGCEPAEDEAGTLAAAMAAGDNYSDTLEPRGGGGARFACGLIRP